MVSLVETKLLLLNGYGSYFYKIGLTVRTSMYTWTNVASSIPTLMSKTCLPTGIMNTSDKNQLFTSKRRVERAHCSIGDHVRDLLTGAALDI